MKLTVAMVILWWKLTFTMVIYGENWQPKCIPKSNRKIDERGKINTP
jgi:hypothetical protein